MQDSAAKAEKCRDRAKRIRKISLDVRGDDHRKYLLNLAKEYEQMAKDSGRKSKT